MKKVERINIIMRYINNRTHFTLTEIMREFNISRSTAQRDIREIEALGMPLRLLLVDRYLLITCREDQKDISYAVYLLRLYQEKSLWLIECFDLDASRKRIIPVDQLTDVIPYPGSNRPSAKKIKEKLSKQQVKNNLVLELGPRAIAQYRKYHPFRVALSYTNPYQTTAILKMEVEVNHTEELKEVTNWLLFLGDDLTMKEVPDEVRAELQTRVELFHP